MWRPELGMRDRGRSGSKPRGNTAGDLPTRAKAYIGMDGIPSIAIEIGDEGGGREDAEVVIQLRDDTPTNFHCGRHSLSLDEVCAGERYAVPAAKGSPDIRLQIRLQDTSRHGLEIAGQSHADPAADGV